MRPVQASLIALLVLIVAVVQLRHHLRDLYQVVRMFHSFHPFLRDHPEFMLRYTPSEGTLAVAESTYPRQPLEYAVPRRIHQVFLQEGRTSTLHKYAEAISSCRQLHPGWNHTIWTDDTATAFMREHYPRLYPHYVGYKQSIQRANIVRYALLDHFGGVYLDLDVTCRQSLEPLRASGVPFLTPGAHPAGVNNAFIMSRPGHAFLRKLLSAAPRRDLWWGLPYVENMLSTGCGFFGSLWTSYALAGPRLPGDVVRVLADEEGRIEPHMLRGVVTTPLFKHGGASSWHGWDAAAIVLLGRYLYSPFVVPAVLLSCFAIGWSVWRLFSMKTRRRRRSWGARVREAVSPVEREKTGGYLDTIDEESVVE